MNSNKRTLRQVGIALMLLVAFLVQGTWALAGTTGQLSGNVIDVSGAPIQGATVTATSPSQSATTTTDAAGHFGFLTLAPDTYVLAMTKAGYNPISQGGISVFADNNITVPIVTQKSLKEIGNVTSRSAGDLVKAGTTSDVYSVNAANAEKIAALGGGGNLNNAYSAIYSQPGVSSYIGNYGAGQVFYIRGSNYNQVGYEFDGVPVNRAFDNYAGSSLTNLGQQELQVYTGSGPAGTSTSTVGGYINQVIKTGTYPGTGTVDAGIGLPIFYHKLTGEAGGASPSRLFSYYVGVGGYNQEFRQYNQANGGDLTLANSGLGSGGGSYSTAVNFYNNGIPGCNADGTSPAYGNAVGCLAFTPVSGSNYQTTNQDRENVFNFHFGIPHKHDQGRDDVQILYTTASFLTAYAESLNDFGGLAGFNQQFGGNFCAAVPKDCKGGQLAIPYQDGVIFTPGTTFGQPASTAVAVPYLFPSTNPNRLPGAALPMNQRNTIFNDSTVVKLQYTKNIGSNAYARIYGYSLYSDWLQNGPTLGALAYKLGNTPCCSFAVSRDYELSAHTRGGEFQFADQINSKNLITLTANYVTSSVVRFQNGTMSNSGGTAATNLTDGTNCYSKTTGALGNCFSGSTAGTFAAPVPANPIVGAAAAAGATYRVTFTGERGTFNTVRPEFSSQAINDEFRPNDRLLINAGLRFEQFKYNLAQPGPDFPFWYNAAANTYCYNTSTLAPLVNPLVPGGAPPPASPSTAYAGVPCPAGFAHPSATDPANTRGIVFSAGGAGVIFRNVTSPRFGFTYTINPDTVIRGAIGRFASPMSTAYTQYLDKSGKSSAAFNFTNFFKYGYPTPIHELRPQISNNADLSLEKRLHGTDISFKLSPFYRYTTDQLNTISIGPNFASALNAGTQRSYGVELAINKGDPSRNGLSGQLSYTYTHARVQFSNLSNGRNGIDPINDYIVAYNRLTSFCAGSTDPRCTTTGTATPLAPAAPLPCYAPNSGTPSGGGTAGTCTGGASTGILNPYYNAAPQPLVDRGASYDVYPNSFPSQPAGGPITSFGPNAFSGFLNWKKDRLTITPNFQLVQGQAYGSPVDILGVDPRVCANNQANGNAAVAAAGGNPNAPDFTSCNASVATGNGYLAIPNPQTGQFTQLAQYREPWQLNINAQIGYDISKKTHATLTLANIVNTCFGGSSTPWSSLYGPGRTVCGYNTNGGIYQSNFYNGASPSSPVNGSLYPTQKQPYGPFGGLLPFNAYLDVQFKI